MHAGPRQRRSLRISCPPELLCVCSPEGLAAVDHPGRVQQLAPSRDVAAVRQRVSTHSILDVLQCKQAKSADIYRDCHLLVWYSQVNTNTNQRSADWWQVSADTQLPRALLETSRWRANSQLKVAQGATLKHILRPRLTLGIDGCRRSASRKHARVKRSCLI
jgi:hypothetical protein